MEITLSQFIQKLGDKESAKLFGVKERTTASWRRMERKPRDEQAQVILAKTKNHRFGPVTYAGIYSPQRPN